MVHQPTDAVAHRDLCLYARWPVQMQWPTVACAYMPGGLDTPGVREYKHGRP